MMIFAGDNKIAAHDVENSQASEISQPNMTTSYMQRPKRMLTMSLSTKESTMFKGKAGTTPEILDHLHKNSKKLSLFGRMIKGYEIISAQTESLSTLATAAGQNQINEHFQLQLTAKKPATFVTATELVYAVDNGLTKTDLRLQKDHVCVQRPENWKVTFLKRDQINPQYILVGYEDSRVEIISSETLQYVFSTGTQVVQQEEEEAFSDEISCSFHQEESFGNQVDELFETPTKRNLNPKPVTRVTKKPTGKPTIPTLGAWGGSTIDQDSNGGQVANIILMDEPHIHKDKEYANLVTLHKRNGKHYVRQQVLSYAENNSQQPYEKHGQSNEIPVYEAIITLASNGLLLVCGSSTEIWMLRDVARESGRPDFERQQTFQMAGYMILEYRSHLILMDRKQVQFWTLTDKDSTLICQVEQYTLNNVRFQINDAAIVHRNSWLVIATQQGLISLEISFCQYDVATEQLTDESLQQIQESIKDVTVLQKGNYWDVEVSPCGDFVVALEQEEYTVVVIDAVTKETMLKFHCDNCMKFELSSEFLFIKDDASRWILAIDLQDTELTEPYPRLGLLQRPLNSEREQLLVCGTALRVKFGGNREEPVVISKPCSAKQTVILSLQEEEDGIEISNMQMVNESIYFVKIDAFEEPKKVEVGELRKDVMCQSIEVRDFDPQEQEGVKLLVSPDQKTIVLQDLGVHHCIFINEEQRTQYEVWLPKDALVLTKCTHYVFSLKSTKNQRRQWYMVKIVANSCSPQGPPTTDGYGEPCPGQDFLCDGEDEILRMSPSLTSAAVRFEKYVQITDLKRKKRVYVTSCNTKNSGDFFFLNDDFLALPLDSPPFHYQIFRVSDGSSLCILDCRHKNFAFATDCAPEMRTPDATPTGIVDLVSGMVYNVSLKSLIHIGVKSLRLYPCDFPATEPQENQKFQILGLPAIPHITLLSLHEFLRISSAEKEERVCGLSRYVVMKRWPGEKNVNCEDVSHFLLKRNFSTCLEHVLLSDRASYIACPKSPFQRIQQESAKHFLKFIRKQTSLEDYQILMKMQPIDYQSLLWLPENMALEFFEEMAIEEKHSFENYKTATLNEKPQVLVEDLMQVHHSLISRTRVRDHLFSEGNKSVRIFKLTIHRHKVGSNESFALLNALLKFGIHDIFETKAVQHYLEFHLNEIYSIGLYSTLIRIVLLVALWFTRSLLILGIQTLYFLVNELYQMYHINSAVGYMPYLNFENLIDWIRIIMQTWYVIGSFGQEKVFFIPSVAGNYYEGKRVTLGGLLFAGIMFLQWIQVLNETRYWKKHREFIMVMRETMKAIVPFLVSLAVIFISICDFMYFKEAGTNNWTMERGEKEPMAYLKIVFHNFISLICGEFRNTELQDLVDFVVFVFGTLFIMIILLNLLIAIISDTHEKIQASLKKSEGLSMCELILELETMPLLNLIVRYMRSPNDEKYGEGYLFCAEYKRNQHLEDWQGRVHQIVKLVSSKISQLDKRQQKMQEKIREEAATQNKQNLLALKRDLKNDLDRQMRELLNPSALGKLKANLNPGEPQQGDSMGMMKKLLTKSLDNANRRQETAIEKAIQEAIQVKNSPPQMRLQDSEMKRMQTFDLDEADRSIGVESPDFQAATMKNPNSKANSTMAPMVSENVDLEDSMIKSIEDDKDS